MGDLRELEPPRGAIASADRIIHTATAWGDPERARQVNVVAVKELLRLTDPERLQQVIYFSTASILDRQLQLLPEAMAYGTEYIQTKATACRTWSSHPLAERIVAVFPTLVFGGSVGRADPHPTSYLTAGLKEAFGWLWLARWLRTDASFHFIHAADIATVCAHLATTPHRPTRSRAREPCAAWCWARHRSRSTTPWPPCAAGGGVGPPVGVDLRGWLIEGLISCCGSR